MESHPLARRLQHIAPFHVMELLTRARQLEAEGRSIVHMEIGEPDFPTAQPVIEAGMAALARGDTAYTPAAGLPRLREAIAQHYRDEYAAHVDPGQVFVTPGASGALLLALALLVDPGNEVLVPDPGYPCNRHFVRLFNGVPKSLPVAADSAYQLTAEIVAREWSENTVAAMIGSPGNPTGTIIAAPVLAELQRAVESRGGRLIVDEIYHGLTYGTSPATAAGDGALVVNSFSKYFGMTGWRLGWLVVPRGLERAAERLAQNVFIAASTPAQHAAMACFTPAARSIFEERRRAFERRRDYLQPALDRLGFRIPGVPEGAFYLYADASTHTRDSFAFATTLLEEAGVAVTPGVDFGDHRARQHVRFAYTTAMERLEEGVLRLEQFLGGR